MPEWNELFLDRKNVVEAPQPELGKMLILLEERFTERPLRVWDVCSGAGRNVEFIASLGHDAYGSDISGNGLRMTGERLRSKGLTAHLAKSDMTENPWGGARFHGAFSWNSLHHNTLANVRKAVDAVRESLVPGGLFMVNLLHGSGAFAGQGEEVEPGTFIRRDGLESGVPHHYFAEGEILSLFEGFELESLVEIQSKCILERDELRERYLFPDSKWGILARRK